VLPLGPVKQYADEPSDEPTALIVYPGTDGTSVLYDDDGTSFSYRRGEFMRLVMSWNDAQRKLTLRLAPNTKVIGSASKRFRVRVAGSTAEKVLLFTGKSVEISMPA